MLSNSRADEMWSVGLVFDAKPRKDQEMTQKSPDPGRESVSRGRPLLSTPLGSEESCFRFSTKFDRELSPAPYGLK